MDLKMNPFQSYGIVWNNTKGMILLTTSVRTITEKPKFSFEFDSLYCEPTTCHKVVNSFDQHLTVDEIAEVLAYLEVESAKPDVVNGVDADGRYLEGVTADKVARIVATYPPGKGVWRLDMTKANEENWYQPYCVNAEGELVDVWSEDEKFTIVPVTYPVAEWGEVWRWNKRSKKWVDKRSDDEVLAYVKEVQTERAKSHALSKASTGTIKVGDYEFSADPVSRAAINEACIGIALGAKTVSWTPKGKTEPVVFKAEFFTHVQATLRAVTDECMNKYFVHKAAIAALTKIQDVKDYDFTDGY